MTDQKIIEDKKVSLKGTDQKIQSNSFVEIMLDGVSYIPKSALAQTRKSLVQDVRAWAEKQKPILWNDDPNRHLENIAKTNTLTDLITYLDEKMK